MTEQYLIVSLIIYMNYGCETDKQGANQIHIFNTAWK